MEAQHHLNELLDRASEILAKVNPVELCGTLEKISNIRPGLVVPAFNYLKSFGPDVNHVIEPPSSDETSEPESAPPSMNVLVDCLLDSSMISITVPST